MRAVIKTVLFLLTSFLLFFTCGKIQKPNNYRMISHQVTIYPDYTSVTLPPNIAPINFVIKEKGDKFLAIFSNQSDSFKVCSKNGNINIPFSRWKKFAANCSGKDFSIEIFVKKNGQWQLFPKIMNSVAMEKIDGALVYRLLDPAYHIWSKMGIYQRNLENFREKVVLDNRPLKKACLNCHSFHMNNPESMMLHVRGGPGTSLLLSSNDHLKRINTRTAFNASPGAYRCWHPNGKKIAFSVNKVTQFFHATGENRDVFDFSSDLILYDIESNTVSTCQDIASPDFMETYPMWTPDGKMLYFCSAPQADFSDGLNIPYDKIYYSLNRIPFDAENNKWEKVETVLSYEQTGLSIAHPSISPEGNYLLFCMAKYGNFPIYQPSSDLYLLDLKSGAYRRLDINSDKADSYHSWSSNGRWFVFSSKRENGILARPYFCYFKNDQVSKPVLLPQKNPEFYKTFFKTYNVPELIKHEIRIKPNQWKKAAFLTMTDAQLDPAVAAAPNEQTDENMLWQPAQ